MQSLLLLRDRSFYGYVLFNLWPAGNANVKKEATSQKKTQTQNLWVFIFPLLFPMPKSFPQSHIL